MADLTFLANHRAAIAARYHRSVPRGSRNESILIEPLQAPRLPFRFFHEPFADSSLKRSAHSIDFALLQQRATFPHCCAPLRPCPPLNAK